MTSGEASLVPSAPVGDQERVETPQKDIENPEVRFLKFQYAAIDRWCAAFNRPDIPDHKKAKKEPLTAFDWITAGYAAKCRALFDKEKEHAALVEEYAEAMGWYSTGVADPKKLRSVWEKMETILYGESLPEPPEPPKSSTKKTRVRYSKRSLKHAP